MFPEVLSPLQQELKSWHDKLSHLHHKSMFRLAKLGVLTSRFLDFNDDVPFCASCMFGSSRRSKWRTKEKISGYIRKETDDNTGAAFSEDQLQSAQI